MTTQLSLLSDGRIYSARVQGVRGVNTQMWSPREGRNFSLDTETIASCLQVYHEVFKRLSSC